MMTKWISLRNRFPEEPGTYKVRDCKENVEGIGEYDGFDFTEHDMERSKRGALILVKLLITHWAPSDELD